MRVVIETIPHEKQRYDTCGDWWWEDETLQTRVSAIPESAGGWRASMCVAIHELTEALLCKARGIDQKAVDDFDMGPGADDDEPGEHPAAPYRREHRAAYVPELFLLDAFDLDVRAYNAALEAL